MRPNKWTRLEELRESGMRRVLEAMHGLPLTLWNDEESEKLASRGHENMTSDGLSVRRQPCRFY
jgi:hypothetical protein